jgi:hypothetical protein
MTTHLRNRPRDGVNAAMTLAQVLGSAMHERRHDAVGERLVDVTPT